MKNDMPDKWFPVVGWMVLIAFWLTPVKTFAQNSHKDINQKLKNGGVVITLDDKYVDDWMRADSVVSANGKWRAVFCVSAFQKLSDTQKKQLLVLQGKGHEIAYHGTLHVDAVKYISEHTIAGYIRDELAQLEPMRKYGLHVNSFAYPSGSRNAQTDSLLLGYFSMLRGVTNAEVASKLYNCYFNAQPVVDGIGIEYHYAYFNDAYLRGLLDYARLHKKILVVYGHKPVANPLLDKHEVAFATLRLISDYVKKYNMAFLTLNDLAHIH